MRACRACIIILVFAAVTFAVSIPISSEQADGAITPDADLIEQYPDADFIIYDNGRSGMVVAERTARSSTASESANPSIERPDHDWIARSVSTGSSQTLRSLSDADGSIHVVMVSGRLGTLTLLQANTLSSDAVDVSFLMVGGSLDSLKVMSVQSSLKGKLQTSYTFIDRLLGDVILDLDSGSITEVCPTEDMVAGSSMDVTVSKGMSVDRLLLTGKNGKYDDATFTLDGGSVGYMTNLKSMVGSLTYRLWSGSVDYFCIGADTEYGSNSMMSSLNTFYVKKDVVVHIDETVSFRSVILGSGIVEFPTVLWNGTSVSRNTIDNMAKNITIDASGVAISLDKCFKTVNRSQNLAYQFSTYVMGGAARTKTLSSDYYDANYRVKPVYGFGGVWASAADVAIPTGFMLVLDCDLSVPHDTVVTVSEGSRLTIAGNVFLEGEILNNGEIVNTGVIEKSKSGGISGTAPSGDGFIAYCITVNPHDDGTIDVMASDDEAVVIRTSGEAAIRSISVLLINGDREVSIKAPESIRIGGERFMIALRSLDAEDWDASYDLYIEGIDADALSTMDVTVTVPSPGHADYVVYRQGDSGSVEKMESLDSLYSEVTFVAKGTGQYNLSTAADLDEGSGFSLASILNYLLAAAIAVVGSATIWILLKKD